ncbi:MAG: hypothetical protein OEX02_20460, partial [Cyclobacteriaceae bacterium]|nr:hypothetical protein [Cyclobacteriaceae bacterium]
MRNLIQIQPSKAILFFLLINLACSNPVNKDEQTNLEDKETNIQPDRLDNYTEWGIYRGDKKANQYSELAQIHGANVHKLKPLWEYHTDDFTESSSMQCNPIVVDGIMYFSTFFLNAVALDPTTGEELWVFNSAEHNENNTPLKGRNRGVTFWEDGQDKRIFLFVKNRVYALEAKTGKLIESFGNGGHIDLRENLDTNASKTDVEVTTPGIVYKNLLIVT